MYTYIEVWNAKPAWLALSQQARQDYISQIVPAIGEMGKAGIEPLSWGFNDPDTPHRASYEFFAVWQMPNKAAALTFEQAVEQAGWHEYFEQQNLRGEGGPPDAVIAHHLTM